MPASSMSAMQIDDGGAVNAYVEKSVLFSSVDFREETCKLIVSSVVSGSSEMIRTV